MDCSLLFAGAKFRQKLSDLNAENKKRRDECAFPVTDIHNNADRTTIKIEYCQDVEKKLQEKNSEV